MACSLCNDSGWIRYELPITDPAFGRLTRCSCQVDADRAKWKKDCGLTASQLAMTITGFKRSGTGTADMVAAGKEFMREPVGTLFIHGANGVGKTTMAYAMVPRLIEAGYQTVYVTGPNMFSWIRDGYSAKTQDDGAMRRLDRLQNIRVLILDELDKVRPTDWVLEIMSMFIDGRYRRKDELGTVVICNSPDNLTPDVVSRLMEGRVVENRDSDYRKGGVK